MALEPLVLPETASKSLGHLLTQLKANTSQVLMTPGPLCPYSYALMSDLSVMLMQILEAQKSLIHRYEKLSDGYDNLLFLAVSGNEAPDGAMNSSPKQVIAFPEVSCKKLVDPNSVSV